MNLKKVYRKVGKAARKNVGRTVKRVVRGKKKPNHMKWIAPLLVLGGIVLAGVMAHLNHGDDAADDGFDFDF